MNWIKIKDDYINLDNVNDIRVYDHGLLFTFNGPDDEAFMSYQDNAGKPTYNHRALTTEELEQLKDRIEYAVLNNQTD